MNSRRISALLLFAFAGGVGMYSGVTEAYAAKGDIIESGNVSEYYSATYTITEIDNGNYCLKVSGDDFGSTWDKPWEKYDNITELIVDADVEKVSYRQFYGMKSLEKVTLPEGLTGIGEEAFKGTSIKEVTIPGTVKVISEQAFSYNDALEKVVIKEGVETLDYSVFYDCSNLTSISIPKTVTTLENGAINYTPYFENLKDKFAVVGDGILVKYNGNDSNLVIPDNVKTIMSRAFDGNTDIKSVTFSDNLTTLGDYVFSGCSKLETVKLNKNLNTLGFDVFMSTPFIDKFTDNMIILDGRILYKYMLQDETKITIPEGIEVIAPYAISRSDSLAKVELPQSLKYINRCGITDNNRLKRLTIPASVKEIAQYGVGYLQTSYGMSKMGDFSIIGKNDSYAQSYAGDNYFTFYDSDKLTGKIGETATYAIDLDTKTATVSGTGKTYDFKTSYWDSEDYSPLYYYIEGIDSLVISEGITEISKGLMISSGWLSELVLPESLNAIDSKAFSGLSKLTSIVIPANVEKLYPDSFYAMSGLKNVSVAEDNKSYLAVDNVIYTADMKELIYYPYGSQNENISIPKTVEKIWFATLLSAEALKNIYIPGDISLEFGYGSYYSNNKNIYFYGDAPNLGYDWYSLRENNIYYFSENEGWENVIYDYSGTCTFTDLQEMKDGGITLSADEICINVGDEAELVVFSENFDNTDFIWTSSNYMIAGVNNEGIITAISPGEAVITVTNFDGSIVLSCKVIVVGELVLADYEYIPLDEKLFSNGSAVAEPIVVDGIDGFYIINGNKLILYSFYNMEAIELMDLGGYRDYYQNGNYLYFMYAGYNSGYTINKLDLTTLDMTTIVEENTAYGEAVGADNSGRIYVAQQKNDDHSIVLYSAAGANLSEIAIESTVYHFGAFDETNGNFYYEAYMNWVYWGYDHAVSILCCGNVKDNKLTGACQILGDGYYTTGIGSPINGNFIFHQNGYYQHYGNIKMLDGKYIALNSNFSGYIGIFNSNDYVCGNDQTCLNTVIGKDKAEINGWGYDTSSYGTGVVYFDKLGDVIAYTGSNTISQIDLETNNVLYDMQTKHPVYSLLKYKNQILAIEKEDGSYYFELISWDIPTEVILEIEKSTIGIAESTVVTASVDGSLIGNFEFESSDKTIASVNSDGIVVGWKAGTVTITATETGTGLKATIKLNVTQPAKLPTTLGVVETTGKPTGNISGNAYGTGRSSYLYVYNNNIIRVEAGEEILVENYDMNHKLLSTKTIKPELTTFGAFYAGEKNNYIVYGQGNRNESDDVEVLRIVKYGKDWKRISACSVYGANTLNPFAAGSCRITETDNKLYIHTCHTMYKSSDGLNHQANMTYVVDENEMKITSSYYDVMNSSVGYVSHSFNQYIKTDGKYIYRVDHGDAYPRSVFISKFAKDSDVTDLEGRGSIYLIKGNTGDNATGVSVGGFELSPLNYLVAINSVDMEKEEYSAYGNRNIYLVTGDLAFTKLDTKQITHYTAEDNITVNAPQLVKYNDYMFLLLWEETNQNTYNVSTKMLFITDEGEAISNVVSTKLRLSDCNPIVIDGRITWYTTDGSKMKFYAISPFDMDKVKVIEPKSENLKTEIAYLAKGEKLEYYNGLSAKKTYSSSNDKIVKVDANGNVTFVGVGTAIVTVEVAETDKNFSAKTTIEYTVTKVKINADNVTIKEKTSAVYTGKALKPDLEIVYNGYTLVSGTDYVITASNNINVGTAKYTIAGRGNFSGNISGTFEICEKSQSKNPFVDVKDDAWYAKDVLYAYERGAMTGLDETHFGPNDNLTRAMTVTLLWKIEGSVKNEKTVFPDVKATSWYGSAVAWAKANSIVGGYTSGDKAGMFGPKDDITRQDFVKILYSYAQFKGYDTKVKSSSSYLVETDAASVSKYARESVNWGFENGFIGNNNPLLNPKKNITRKEAAAMIARFLQKYT